MDDFNRPIKWENPSVSDCSHIYSDGTNVSAIFQEKEDKFRIMDMLAITAFENDVKILVAEVMTTHFHAIVSGRDPDRERYKCSTKRKLEIWIAAKGLKGCVKGELRISNDPIEDEDELKGKIMYVYRNSLCAGIRLVPWRYEGGPGDIYFVDHHKEKLKGKPIGELSGRKIRSLFHTGKSLPVEWRYDEVDLRILPHSYMDWERVESLFKSLRAFVAFLAQKKDLEVKYDLECASSTVQKASESELRKEVRELCSEYFGLNRVSEASLEQKTLLARRLWERRRTYSLSVLSRISLLPKEYLEGLFGHELK